MKAKFISATTAFDNSTIFAIFQSSDRWFFLLQYDLDETGRWDITNLAINS